MTIPKDPPRWSESADGPAALRNLLSAAKRDVATDAELSELGARLEPVLGAPTGSAGAPALLKLAAGGLVALLGLGAVLALRHSGPAPSPASSARPAVVTPLAAAGSARSQLPLPELPSVATPVAPTAAEAAPSRPPASSAKKWVGGAAAQESQPMNAQAEASLLEQARSALGASPARALSLTQQHAQQFPRGLLAQEREVIAISALRRLGRTTEADARAARFDARYPHSAHQQAVDRPGTR